MSVRIGHASIDERGKSSGGQAGDQTGKEVCARAWYVSGGGWTDVLRPVRPVTAERMARACECACANPNIGYDQGQRNTLRDKAVKVNFDLSKITEKCETDCSALMTVCAEAAGIDVAYTIGAGGWRNAPVTGNMVERFMATGAFEHLTDRKYLTTDKYLRRGDVLVRRSGHTAMVLEDGEEEQMDISRLTDEECWEIVEKANRHAATLAPSAYAREACRNGIRSGLFTDGNRDGLVDNPQSYVKRQELATVLDRGGMLG